MMTPADERNDKTEGGGSLRASGVNATPSVMAAMSGGVDSSVMALLLHQQGFDVVGVTMKLRPDETGASCGIGDGASTCCSLEDVEDARDVCRRLGVPHYTFNFGDRFDDQVIGRFCSAYLEGRTPNPCIDCNRYLKFESLQRRRRELDLDYVATGHYARRVLDESTQTWQLLRARDASKDQSYVLYHVTQDILAHMLFPLGEMTKPEVRALAAENGLVTASKPESQDICFVPDGDYAAFINRHEAHKLGELDAFTPGDIVDREGRVLGTHRGLIHYTPGQRKGIGIAAAEPLYVYAKDSKHNQLVVGYAREVNARGIEVRDVNIIAGSPLEGERKLQVKTHYRQRPVEALVEQPEEDLLVITFAEPQRVPAPGQAAVVYDGDAVVGGGSIERVF